MTNVSQTTDVAEIVSIFCPSSGEVIVCHTTEWSALEVCFKPLGIKPTYITEMGDDYVTYFITEEDFNLLKLSYKIAQLPVFFVRLNPVTNEAHDIYHMHQFAFNQ